LALLHELQQPNEHGEPPKTPIEKAPPTEKTLKRMESIDVSSWMRSISQAAEKKLRVWIEKNLRAEHYMATVLNPRLKQLPLINDIEK
jgi:hypothetical protein